MAKYAPTPEQEEVIGTTDRTVLLSAAAGSGKTATLTKRLITMITEQDPPLDVTRMLVVTFTRAAAEELRTRISEALTAAAEARPDDPYLTKQLLLLPTARIRTIDAFCNDLVKGHTETLGISPLYRIADEAEIDILGISILDDLIEDAYDGALGDRAPDIAAVVEASESVKSQGSLAEQLYQLYKNHLHGQKNGVALLASHADTLEKEASLPFFETRAGKALAKHYKEIFTHKDAVLTRAFEALQKSEGDENIILKTLFPRLTYFHKILSLLRAACDVSFEELKSTAAGYELPPVPNCPRGYEYTAEEALYKQLLSDTNTELQKLFKTFAWDAEDLAYVFRQTARITRTVYDLLSEMEVRLNAEKRRRAIFDYDDITGFAHKLLCTEDDRPTPLALEFQNAFDAVCIDEYQDVNAIQHRIFEVISTERNRFMVGDIKQSIYAFRGAVPDIFNELRRTFPSKEKNKSSAVLYLTENFRSEEPVITFANGIFDFLFPIIGASIDYRAEDALRTRKTREEYPVLPLVSLLVREKKEKGDEEFEDEENGENNTQTEDERVAELVLSLLKTGKRKNGDPLRPSDIAILTREYPYHLIETLQKRGIPLKTKDKTDFFSRKEILLALSLCHAVNNPHRDIYLAAALRSPLYGFTMDELIAVRRACGEGSLYTALCAYHTAHPDFSKAARVIADLSRFRTMAENTPSHRLIRTVFHDTGIYAVTDSAGRAALRAFYELARSYEANAFRGLYRFLDRTAEIRKYGYGMPERELGEEDAVTVSTIHASKGLEYPVCILAHTGKSLKKADKSPFLYSPEQGLAFAVPSRDGRALLKTPLMSALSDAKTQTEIEEAVRVLYVALTRPKEQLYIFCSNAKKLTETLEKEATLLRLSPTPTALSAYASYATWILAALPGIPSDHRLVKVADTDPADSILPVEEDVLLPQTDAPASDTAIEALRQSYRERFAFRYPHEAETRLPAKLSVSTLYPGVLDELNAQSPFDETPESASDASDEQEDTPLVSPTLPAFLSGETENQAAKAGTATHLFLQFCDFDRILTTVCSQNIKEELERLTAHGFMTEEDAALVRQNELARFLTSDLAKELLAAEKLYREFRFHAMLPAQNFSLTEAEAYRDVPLFVQGVIDLLLVRKDGSLLLVDYKTDRLPYGASDEKAKAFLFERHGTQLSVYADAIAHIFGKAPDVAIYSLPKGKLFFQ